MKQITEHDVWDAMESHGGSFVKALGAAWRRADLTNAAKLHEVFPEYWEEYRQLATDLAARAEAKVRP